MSDKRHTKVLIIGSGPAGLVCAGELARLGHRPAHGKIVNRPFDTPRKAFAHPQMIKWDLIEFGAILAERVEIAVTQTGPVDELDA